MSVRDLLIELGTEELPPLALRELENAFAEGVRSELSAAGIGFTALKSYATPRRLAVLISAPRAFLSSAESAPIAFSCSVIRPVLPR